MSKLTNLSNAKKIKQALGVLTSSDPILAHLASVYGVPILSRSTLPKFTLEQASVMDDSELDQRLFSELVETVLHQQLAGSAAIAITSRLKSTLGGVINSKAILSAEFESLRAAGLSGSKSLAIIRLAEAVESREIVLSELASLKDDEVTASLCSFRGFGPWSAQMFLMFSLGRLDVWPASDLGVRKGYRHSYRLEELPSAKELESHGERFRPYRSLVAWYMWRALNDDMPDNLYTPS